jgi:hypothetical protein
VLVVRGALRSLRHSEGAQRMEGQGRADGAIAMSESTRPELCEDCKLQLQGKRHRAHCKTFPITCTDQRDLWDAGYDAAMLRVQELVRNRKRGPVVDASKDPDDGHWTLVCAL